MKEKKSEAQEECCGKTAEAHVVEELKQAKQKEANRSRILGEMAAMKNISNKAEAYNGPCEAMPNDYKRAPADRPRAKMVGGTARPLYHEDCGNSHPYTKKAYANSNPFGLSGLGAELLSKHPDPALAGLGMAAKARRNGSEGWRDRYLLLQAEMIDDARRWFTRIENLVQAQVEQMREMRDETEKAMEEGYEEAYKMLREVTQQKQLLEAENKQLRDRVKQLEDDRDVALQQRLKEYE